MITFETVMNLPAKIRYLALSGESEAEFCEGRSDYMHDLDKDVYWQKTELYLNIYIESYADDYSYSYRLYRISGDIDDYKCLFNLEENDDEITFLYLHNTKDWYEDYEKTISGLIT